MMTIGIDVGTTGAIAFLDREGSLVEVYDLPICINGRIKWIDGPRLLTILRTVNADMNETSAQAFIERTQATPKLGVTTANSMGLTLGSTVTTLQIAGVSTELVMPAVWKRAMGLIMPGASDKDKKAACLTRARMLFPGNESLLRAKDHNRGEAALIAHYGFRIARGEKPANESTDQSHTTGAAA